jgi:diguanylate cyclase (GGDEF)-like protein
MRLLVVFERWPPWLSILLGVVLLGVIGYLDYVSGYELSFSAAYLIPIFLLAWGSGWRAGLAGAVASVAIRTAADLLGGLHYSHPALIYGNAGMRFALFAGAALVLSALRRMVDDQRSLAATDHLTGAQNSRAFRETLRLETERSRRYQRPYTLAYFDLDNFKTINDSLGHAEGDEVLRVVVSAIRSNTRSSDTIGRVGGDEFTLLLPETDSGQARVAVDKIRDGILQEVHRRNWDVTVSIGACSVTGADIDVDSIIGQADRLMYEAKVAGKNTVRFAAPEQVVQGGG